MRFFILASTVYVALLQFFKSILLTESPKSEMAENNVKTVFVLDHTPYFGISGENYIDLGKINPISKSLWTSTVESSVEYCRIVWDLFPSGKLVSLPYFHQCEKFKKGPFNCRSDL